MTNLTRRARRRRRSILADQLAASLTTARIGWSRAERGEHEQERVADEPAQPDPANGGLPPEPAAATSEFVGLPAVWLTASAAFGRIRARRPALARRRAALPPASPPAPVEWPPDLEGIGERVGLEVGPWTGGRCQLHGDAVGSLSITVEPHRGGWEELMFDRDHGGRDDTLDITEESPHLWFGDLYERIDDLGDAAVWAAMARTLRVLMGGSQVTVELDVELGEAVPDLELATAVCRAVMTDVPAETPTPTAKRRWGFRRR